MSEDFSTKIERCRYSWIGINNKKIQYSCRKQDGKIVCNNECEHCDMYDSRFIEYPIIVNAIEQKSIDYSDILYKSYVGKPVAVRLCNNDKTYLGLFLGELPSSSTVSLNKENVLTVNHMMNPAMFVPELNKIVFGYESWWMILESEKDFKEITDIDIENIWYVRALKSVVNSQQ